MRACPVLVPSLTLALAACAACAGESVVWTEPRAVAGAIGRGAHLAFGAGGEPVIASHDPPDSATGGRTACEQSPVVADDGAGGAFATWWEQRPDRSVVLLVARRGRDGARAWGPPVVADDRDRGTRGCERPPAAIAADGRRGHVHLAYFLEPRDGAGVYAGHSLEDGSYFHGPVAIVYGDRPVRTAVDVDGDLVVYAHEDPNSVRPRIALAISTTAGHLIEHRLPASPPSVVATWPLVVVDGTRIAVAWMASATPTDAFPGRGQVRVGELGEIVRRTNGGDE